MTPATYREALSADDDYSAIIHAIYGAKATRWTLTQDQRSHPDIRAAYDRKVAADAALFNRVTI